jgi:hypothetical protein
MRRLVEIGRSLPVKNLPITLIAVLACGGVFAEQPATSDLQRMADRFRLSPDLVEPAREAGIGIGEVEVVTAIAAAAKVDPSDVITLKASGMSWPAVFDKYGLKPDSIVRDEEARDALMRGEIDLLTQLVQMYELPPDTLLGYHSRLAGWGEVRLALGMAKKAKVDIETIIARVKKGEGWGKLAAEYKVSIGALMRDPKSLENFGGPETPHEAKKH